MNRLLCGSQGSSHIAQAAEAIDFCGHRSATGMQIAAERSHFIASTAMSILETVLFVVTPSKDEGRLDAIDLLKEDHDEVDLLFKNYEDLVQESAPAKDRRQLSTL